MGSQSFKLTQHLLGMNPYCVVEALLDDNEQMSVGIDFGGGPKDGDEAAQLLWLALTSMPGGLKPLEEIFANVTAGSRSLGTAEVRAGAEWALTELRESLGLSREG